MKIVLKGHGEVQGKIGRSLKEKWVSENVCHRGVVLGVVGQKERFERFWKKNFIDWDLWYFWNMKLKLYVWKFFGFVESVVRLFVLCLENMFVWIFLFFPFSGWLMYVLWFECWSWVVGFNWEVEWKFLEWNWFCVLVPCLKDEGRERWFGGDFQLLVWNLSLFLKFILICILVSVFVFVFAIVGVVRNLFGFLFVKRLKFGKFQFFFSVWMCVWFAECGDVWDLVLWNVMWVYFGFAGDECGDCFLWFGDGVSVEC
jgi:hypothetical protein